ncbi:MAG: glycosyltransferase family 2 protein [Firmicutes bacterium]|nr:glycosyltransferase family 2 protein [Bacillota bacterium]
MNAGITVVIPTYGHAHLIQDALNSIFNQTLLPETVVVINDGSPDDTDAAVMPYRDRIHYVVQNHQGISATLNASLDYVSTPYVMFLASDDWLEREALEVLLDRLKAHPEVGLVHANRGKVVGDVTWWRDAEVPHYGVYRDLPRLMTRYSVYAPAVLWRTQAVREILPIPPYPYCQDWWMSIKVALNGWAFYGTPEILGYYRRHGKNTTRRDRLEDIVRDEMQMLRDFIDSDQLPQPLVQVAETAIRDRKRVLAWRMVEEWRYREARHLFWQLVHDPRDRFNTAMGFLASWMPRPLYTWIHRQHLAALELNQML